MKMLILHNYKNSYSRLIYAIQEISKKYVFFNLLNLPPQYATSVGTDIYAIPTEIFKQNIEESHVQTPKVNLSIQFFMHDKMNQQRDISNMSTEEIDNAILTPMSKNNDSQVTRVIMDCYKLEKVIGYDTLKQIFNKYSLNGKPDVVEVLLKYTSKVIPVLHKQHGEFLHYLAKAQCMKGNSDKGLSILTECYENNEGLRSLYRLIFRDLIQDSVLNRSEASLVIFRKYVMEFSKKFGEDYPLICFWHICWTSSWFSDQMFANELLESSTELQHIVRDKAVEISSTILKLEYNEDAVLRLLQSLLKYEMMAEYTKVLQILFGYKLRHRDVRGCMEIMRNCEVLGITLPADQQGRYIKMLIIGKISKTKEPPTKPVTKGFNMKF